VDIFLERPARPHKVFALLEDTHGGTPGEINDRLSDTARRLGADAILIVSINDKTATEWIQVDPYYAKPVHHVNPHYRPVRYTYRLVRAKAIKYTP
jgi:hypothetical protein